jgi:hypothetical protein
MSTTTLTYPNAIRVRLALVIGLIAILILTSLTLIASSILSALSSTTPYTYQANQIPVVLNSVTAIPVPMPPIVDIQLVTSETRVPVSAVSDELSVVPIPVPTPPSP